MTALRMDENSIKTLFIFGSFSVGMVHFGKIEPHVIAQKTAFARGSVYRLNSGLPVLSSQGAQSITGAIVELSKPDILLALLDEFHGVHHADPERGLFFRESIETWSEEGVWGKTEAYCINTLRLPRGAKIVEDADWKKSLEDKPPLISCLTERQKAYIQKLGASSSRDIVPIDLALYRELMHLEIVVDKGRRLALTSLGLELFRFLS